MGCVNGTSEPRPQGRLDDPTLKKPVGLQKLDCRKKTFQASDKIVQNVKITSHALDEHSESLAKKAIDKHYLFNDLSKEEKDSLVSELIEVEGQKNQYVFKQGDKGSCFFIVKHGKVGVQINGNKVKEMGEGEMFGELALLYCATRSASIKCLQQKTSFLAMKAFVFKKTMKQISLRNAKRLQEIVNRVKIFSYLSNKQRHIISNNLVRERFEKGQCIFKIDQPANSFYIIETGSVKICIPDKEDIIIKKDDSFGQNSFYHDGQRSGSAYANQPDTVLIGIARQQIEKCLGESVSGLIHHNVKKWALTRSPLFEKYNSKEIDLIAESFQLKNSKGNNEILMPKGKHPSAFIICMEGQICGQPPGTMFCDQFYGKKENILSEDVVKNNKGAYATLEFKGLSKINQKIRIGKIGQAKRESMSLAINKSPILDNKSSKVINDQKAKTDFQSFELLQKLGEGQFGEVFLVRNPNQGNSLYAMKCINIQEIKKEGIVQCIVSEREILSKITFPAIVGFVQAYRDQQFVYLLMEFICGVEMFDLLREIGLVNKYISVYFIATLILAVEYLHNEGIVYRDLKPQNSVVGHDGKVYLIDMGTAKRLNQTNSFRTFTIIGTPHYMAPEVFQGKGYSYEVDYWSLGVMLYEFICGSLPYGNNASDPYGIFAQIMSKPLKFPSFANDYDAQLVIQKLLSKNSAERSCNNGLQGIKKMSYFANLQWDEFVRKMKPPYIPKKFRSMTANDYYKNLKGDSFIEQFYRAQNTKNQQNPKNHMKVEKAMIEIWDTDQL